VFKNSKKLAVLIPNMGDQVPIGHHQLSVEVSINGQQFSQNGVTFLYNCTYIKFKRLAVDPNLTEEELKKLDEADEKGKKGPAGKKK